MKKTGTFGLAAAAALVFFAACNNAPSGPSNAHEQTIDPALQEETVGDDNMHIPFDTLSNYFVKNDVKEISNPKITSKTEFDRVFGAATTMGDAGKPTEIDFDTQYVIAVVVPETDVQTVLQPISLRHSEPSEVVFSYRKVTGDTQSHTSRPMLALVVDKEHDGTVILNEMK